MNYSTIIFKEKYNFKFEMQKLYRGLYDYNIKIHHDTTDKESYYNYVRKLHEDKLLEIRLKLQKQKSIFAKHISDNC